MGSIGSDRGKLGRVWFVLFFFFELVLVFGNFETLKIWNWVVLLSIEFFWELAFEDLGVWSSNVGFSFLLLY